MVSLMGIHFKNGKENDFAVTLMKNISFYQTCPIFLIDNHCVCKLLDHGRI